MQVSGPARMGDATFHTVAARLLEVAAVALLVPAVLELWSGYGFATGADPFGAVPSGPVSFSWTRLAQASTIYTFRGPIALLGAAALLLGVMAVLARGVAGQRQAALRREVAVIGSLVGLFGLFHLVAGTAYFLTAEPDPGAPGFARVQEYGALPFPLVTVLLCGLLLLWWLRGGEAPQEEPAAAEADESASATDESASATEDRAVGTGQPTAATGDRAPGTGQPAPAPDQPVDEWLSPDGSSANGFDEYFRRR